MRHEMLTQSALFAIQKGYAESAICDACHTSSGWGIYYVCTYVLRSLRRNNVDRIAKLKPHTLKLILMLNNKVMLLAHSVLRQIIAGV